MYYLNCKIAHVILYEAKRRYAFSLHLYLIAFILTFTFFNKSLSQKKFAKVIEDDIYDKLLEIYRGTEKVVLIKFVETIPYGRSHFF